MINETSIKSSFVARITFSLLWFVLGLTFIFIGARYYHSPSSMSWLQHWLSGGIRTKFLAAPHVGGIWLLIMGGFSIIIAFFTLRSSTNICYTALGITYQPNRKDQIGPIKWQDIASIDIYSYSFGPKRVGYENNLEIKTKAGETITAGCRYADYIALKKAWEERMKSDNATKI